MTEAIYIGIDGGGTKCKVRIEDAKGNLLGQAIGGAANIRLSVDGSWQSIYQIIEEVLKPHEISLYDKKYSFHAGMGLAGCEVKEAYDAFLNSPHPFASIKLTSDAYVACLGAHGGEDGSIIIIGTGVVGFQIYQGKNNKVGGWGFPHDDEGGGAWLGLEAARLTFQWLDQRLEQSDLVSAVFNFFDNDIDNFSTWCNRATSNEFARLAPIVIDHIKQKEPLSIRLINQAAQAINLIGRALEKKHHANKMPLPCCLFGGIAPFIEPYLEKDLTDRLVKRKGDANVGAILMIKENL